MILLTNTSNCTHNPTTLLAYHVEFKINSGESSQINRLNVVEMRFINMKKEKEWRNFKR